MDDIFEVFEDIISDDEEIIEVIEAPRRDRQFRRRPNNMQIWTDEEFLNRFRLSKQTVTQLIQEIQHLLLRPTNQNHALTPETQVLIALRYYATGSLLIVIGDCGGIHKSTTSKVIYDVSRAIASLSPRYIKMPETNEEINETKLQFARIARFPKVIGAIDCTHIRIQSPGGENAEYFRNRKGYFSLNVQTIADPYLKICNIVARWPGASHDSTILNNSRIKTRFEQGDFRNCFLLGDSGYALSEYLMTPLQNPHTPAEHLYNESHIKTRNVVERQYGVMKRRFPVLSVGIRLNIETAKAVIVSAAVLHNIAIINNDNMPNGIIEIENQHDIEILMPQGNGALVRLNLINEYFANL